MRLKDNSLLGKQVKHTKVNELNFNGNKLTKTSELQRDLMNTS